jgi:plastocyanin
MNRDTDVDDLTLTDAELITLLKNHGMNRRFLMKAFGVSAVVPALGGTVAGKQPGGASIDEIYGATYFKGEKVPSGLVDHEVELHAHSPGEHERFPLVEDDTVDRDPDEEGVQGDDDEAPDENPTEFVFDPVGLHVEPGDVVQFTVHGPVTHTVTSFDPYYEGLPKRIPTEDPYSSPPIAAEEDGPADSWLYRFSTTGVHDIVCLPHFPLGMVMRVVVFDPKDDSLANISDYPDLPPVSAFDNANTVLNAPEIDDPDDIVAEADGTVAWADLSI